MAFKKLRTLYSWKGTPYPTPNTGNQAFQWFQQLPQYKVNTPGLVPHRQFFNIGQPQVMSTDTQLMAGLGGLQAGQYIGQGLVIPAQQNATYELVPTDNSDTAL